MASIVTSTARAQQPAAPSNAPPAKAPAKKSSPPASSAPNPKTEAAPSAPDESVPDPDAELQILVRQAGNDPAVLVKNLEAYLERHPDSPRKGAIYRALMESQMNLHNPQGALDYAEKVIAIQPEDSQSMYLATTLLEKLPDDASQLRAIDYDTRLLERVSKADPDSRPQQMTLEDWQSGRNKFMVDLYVLRARIQHHLHKNDEAVKDLTTAYRLVPTAEAALTLGEIAEENKRADEAIRQYAAAFVLSSEQSPDDKNPPLDRDRLRARMGNLWRFSHDSNAGLGDILLSAYDRNHDDLKAEKTDAPVYNKDVSDPLQFSLRHVDGSPGIKLADSHGKVVILNFWTTWCAYCTQSEAMLGDLRRKFSGRADVIFVAINADEDEAGVAPFLTREKVGGSLVFSDGIAQAYHVQSIPTIMVLDKAGKISYRTQGFAPDGFSDLAAGAITKAAAAPGP